MELMTPGSGPLTMSNREIAELVNSRHDKVKQSIERLAERGVIVRPPMADVQEVATTPTGGRRVYVTQEYRIGKRDSYVIVAQLSPEFTARLVDRWQQLEAQAATGGFDIPKDFASALRLAAEQVEKVALLEAKVEEARPYVEFVNGFVEADGLYTLQNAGRALGCRPNLFCAWLREARYVFRQDGVLMPYVGWRAIGLFEVKSNLCESDGKARPQTYITPKGLEYLSSRVPGEIKLTPVTQ